MQRRIIDLSDEPAALSVRYGQLIIKRTDKEDSVPLEELAALIVAHPAVIYTHAVLIGICAHAGSVVLCDDKKMPSGILMPITGHYVQTERFAAQLKTSLPVKKQLWKQIIKAKIKAQARLLEEKIGSDMGLLIMIRKIRSGDPSNIEAQAARRYWPALFGPEFRRIPGSDDSVNRLLNYGYAVLRAMITRALCGVGLHPSIGLHHHNRYNPFCLADDLMEPYRPVVDTAVLHVIDCLGPDTPLDKKSKAILLNELMEKHYKIAGEEKAIFETICRSASSLANIFVSDKKKILFPDF